MDEVIRGALVRYCLEHSCERECGRGNREICSLAELCLLTLGFIAPLTDEQLSCLKRGLTSEHYVCF